MVNKRNLSGLNNGVRGNSFSLPEVLNLEYSEDWIETCRAFRREIYNPASVLYPCCGFDASPAKAFRNVVFLDREQGGNEGCIEALRRAGFRAVKSDIKDYVSEEEHDLLILANPCIPSKLATPFLCSGGYVLLNDYHGNASQLFKLPKEFELIAGVTESQCPTFSRDTSGLFVPVRNLDELKEISPNRYDSIIGLMDSFFRNSTRKRTGSLDKDYLQMNWALYKNRQFPYKRTAEVYAFRKRETN